MLMHSVSQVAAFAQCDTLTPMLRLAAALLLVLIAVAASGAAELVVGEPCGADCSDVGGCAACQLNCHCCSSCLQAVNLGPPAAVGLIPEPSLMLSLASFGHPKTRVAKILHVPKVLL
jgi:hypothetical protein